MSESSLEKILILDDDSDYRILLKTYLGKLLPRVELVEYDPVASGAPDDNFDWSPFDVLILDYYLCIHNFTGLDLLHKYHKNPEFPATIMLTGAGNEEIAVRALKFGIYEYLNKTSLTKDKLKQTILKAWEAQKIERIKRNEITLQNRGLNKELFYQKLKYSTGPDYEGPERMLIVIELDNIEAMEEQVGLIGRDNLLRHIASNSFEVFMSGMCNPNITRLGDTSVALQVDYPDSKESLDFNMQGLCTHLSKRPYLFGGNKHKYTVSIGVVKLGRDDVSVSEFINMAVAASERVRQTDGNAFYVWSDTDTLPLNEIANDEEFEELPTAEVDLERILPEDIFIEAIEESVIEKQMIPESDLETGYLPREEAEEKATEEAREKLEANVKIEAEAKAEAGVQALAEAREKLEAEAQAKAEAKEKAEAEAQALIEAREKLAAEAQAVAEAKEKLEAETKAAAEAKAEADAQAAAEAKEKAEAVAQSLAEAREKLAAEAQAVAEAKEKLEAETKAAAEAKAEADAQAAAEAKEKAEADAQAEAEAKEKLEAEAKAVAEAKEKLEAEARAVAKAKEKLEAEAKAVAEAKEKLEAEARAIAEAKEKLETHSTTEVKADTENEAKGDAKEKVETDVKAVVVDEKEKVDTRAISEHEKANNKSTVTTPDENELKIKNAIAEQRSVQTFQPVIAMFTNESENQKELFKVSFQLIDTEGSVATLDELNKNIKSVGLKKLIDKWMLRQLIGRIMGDKTTTDQYAFIITFSEAWFSDISLYNWLHKILTDTKDIQPGKSIILEVESGLIRQHKKRAVALVTTLQKNHGFNVALSNITSANDIVPLLNEIRCDLLILNQENIEELNEVTVPAKNVDEEASTLLRHLKDKGVRIITNGIEDSTSLTNAISAGTDFAMGIFIGETQDSLGDSTNVESFELI